MRRAISTAVAVMAALVVWPSAAGAQVPSPACATFASPGQVFTLPTTITGNFAAGEALFITFVLQPGQPAGVVQVIVNGAVQPVNPLNPVNAVQNITIPLVAGANTIVLNIEPPQLGIVATVVCVPGTVYPLPVSAPQSADLGAPLPGVGSNDGSGFPLGTAALVAGALLVQAGLGLGLIRRRKAAADAREVSAA